MTGRTILFLIVGSRGWLVFLAGAGNGAFGVRELHCEHQRFVRERLWPTAHVLSEHHEIILILAEAPNAASLIHDHKQEYIAVSSLHLPDERACAAVCPH